MRNNLPNERIKRKYFGFLREAKGLSEETIDGVAKALSRFEEHTRHRDFKSFHIEQANSFKRHLANHQSTQTSRPLSKATVYSTLKALKDFFRWLAREAGYKSKFSYSDAEYFNPPRKDARIAKTVRVLPSPTLEQIKHTIAAMPVTTDVELRDRALIAFAILTGARDGAIASLKLRHVSIEGLTLDQDAREVKTKFSKTIQTTFFPVGPEILEIVSEWVELLREQRLWGLDDPLFPATRIIAGPDRKFRAGGLDRRHWSSAGPIRKIFRSAFSAAGLPYFNPHSFRKTLALLGGKACKSPEEYKAWSQNLGHDNVLTTFSSYGNVSEIRQTEIIKGFSAAIE